MDESDYRPDRRRASLSGSRVPKYAAKAAVTLVGPPAVVAAADRMTFAAMEAWQIEPDLEKRQAIFSALRDRRAEYIEVAVPIVAARP